MALFNALKGTLSDVVNKANSAAGALDSAYGTSAMQLQMDLANQTNAFNAAQASLNRAFQQSSAERSMDVSALEAEKARQFSAEQAELNRKFQKEMSDTAYSRAVKDLKNAGLNPMLIYQSLGSASTPSGSTASSFAGSGSSASGSSASGVMADIASAKRADLSALSDLIPYVALTGVTNAIQALAKNETIKQVGKNFKEASETFASGVKKGASTWKNIKSGVFNGAKNVGKFIYKGSGLDNAVKAGIFLYEGWKELLGS